MKNLFIKRLAYLTLITFLFFIAYLSFLYKNLPSVEVLKDIKLQVPLRIYTADKKLIAEFGEKRRFPVEIADVPPLLLKAFITTEDRRFYQHAGVDLKGLGRAAIFLLTEGKKGQGGSTITMQVARNFFLTRKKTYSRKINEILLALKIEQELSKDKILELYINKVFLGYRAYGIVAAAQVYYGKQLNELTLAEMALLAGLPKAPSVINPIANPEKAKQRRNVVLTGMYETGLINKQEWQEAISEPIKASYHGTKIEVSAPYIAEMVRQALMEKFGPAAYSEGFQVYTTIDSKLQNYANYALQNGLLAYDKRYGLRTLPKLENIDKASSILREMPKFNTLFPAIVLEVGEDYLITKDENNNEIKLNWQAINWARRSLGPLRVSYFPKKAADIATVGNIVYLEPASNGDFKLSQIPQVEGALVSLNPENGSILALVGGFSYNRSKFNRVTQAELQPGSAFKPFIYTAALANGFTPISIINDSPIVLKDPAQEELWRPQNDNLQFNGPTTLREGLIRSRNLVSIRLLQEIGIGKVINYLQRFGFPPQNLPKGPSLALGTANVTPLELAKGFAILANGGFDITPYFIGEIKDANNDNIFQNETRLNSREAKNVIDSRDAYIMNLLLQDAIERGTARGVKSLGRSDLAGKTGTTNDQYDTWFSGFNADIVTTVWVGYDNPKTLGEYGATVALPIWREFMGQALKGKPNHTMAQPSGLVWVKIDPSTGLLARSNQKAAKFEIFKKENVPTSFSEHRNEIKKEFSETNFPEEIF